MTSVKCLNCGNQFSEERRDGSCNQCGSTKRLNAAAYFNMPGNRAEKKGVMQILVDAEETEVDWEFLAHAGPEDPTADIPTGESQ